MIQRFLLLGSIVLLTCIGCASISGEQSSTSDKLPATPPIEQNAPQTNTDSKTAPITFAPTYLSEEDDKYYDAMEIYESSPAAPQGVYHFQGLVFVIVVIDTNRENIQYLEGTAMLRVKALMQKEFPSLPANFRLRNKLVENELDDDTGIYRYAVVFRQSDINKLIP